MMRRWLGRVAGALAVAAIGWVALWAMDFDPSPLLWILMVLLGASWFALVADTTRAGAAEWSPPIPAAEDRFEESTRESRVLDSHLNSSTPGDALNQMLAELARSRPGVMADPAVGDILADPTRRLTLREIDTVVTTIERHRDVNDIATHTPRGDT